MTKRTTAILRRLEMIVDRRLLAIDRVVVVEKGFLLVKADRLVVCGRPTADNHAKADRRMVNQDSAARVAPTVDFLEADIPECPAELACLGCQRWGRV